MWLCVEVDAFMLIGNLVQTQHCVQQRISLPPSLPARTINVTPMLYSAGAISQQLCSGAIQLTSAAMLRFILLLDQNQAEHLERVNKHCQLYQAWRTQIIGILERNNNRFINSPHTKQKCQCPVFVLWSQEMNETAMGRCNTQNTLLCLLILAPNTLKKQLGFDIGQLQEFIKTLCHHNRLLLEKKLFLGGDVTL